MITLGIQAPRPLTHDLFKNALVEWGIMISKVVITRLDGDTYIAQIHSCRGGKEKIIDSRSSDAVAMALVYGSPIFVEEDLIVQIMCEEQTQKIIDLIQRSES